MGVLISNRQNKVRIQQEKLRKTAREILDALAFPDGELSVLVVDDSEIAELNRTYLGREGPTNVIAFPMREGEFSEISPYLLGDVVISAETAEREGMESGIPGDERFLWLLVHGILHLLGYDHETSEDDAETMNAEANRVLAAIAG